MSNSKLKSIKKIFISDDHRIFANGLKLLLSDSDKYKFVGYEPDGEKVIRKVQLAKPDILLLDLNMPGKDGVAILKKLGKPINY